MYKLALKIFLFFGFAQVIDVAYIHCMDSQSIPLSDTAKTYSWPKIAALLQMKPEFFGPFIFKASLGFLKCVWSAFVYHFVPRGAAYIEEKSKETLELIGQRIKKYEIERVAAIGALTKQVCNIEQNESLLQNRLKRIRKYGQMIKLFLTKQSAKLDEAQRKNSDQLMQIEQTTEELIKQESQHHQEEQRLFQKVQELNQDLNDTKRDIEQAKQEIEKLQKEPVSERAQQVWELLQQCEKQQQQPFGTVTKTGNEEFNGWFDQKPMKISAVIGQFDLKSDSKLLKFVE